MKRGLFAIPAIFALCAPCVRAQTGRTPAAVPNLAGVYQAIPNGATLPGGLRNSGNLNDLALTPNAADQAKSTNPKDDPFRVCKPLGPFRMMALDRNKIEVVPSRGMIYMLFEDLSHGHIRVIFLDRQHPAKLAQSWEGDAAGHWEGDTLVVDTVGFNDQTWLNSTAQHSDALHLIERFRPVMGGKYLEYKMTAEDPKVLVKPYSYTRYYEKLNSEIQQDICEDQD